MVRFPNRTYRTWRNAKLTLMVRLQTAPTGPGANRLYRIKYLNFMKPHRTLWNMRPITSFANDTARLDEDNLLFQHNNLHSALVLTHFGIFTTNPRHERIRTG